jgi:cytoskeleton protein RodZ
VTTSAAPSTTASATPTTSAPLPTTGIVVLRTRGESWVEVVDAKGVVAVRKIMAPGETAGASGALPLSVTVGKADRTQVEVRGKAFDLKPVSKDNVARFVVK